MFAVDSTEAIYRVAGLKAQEAIISALTHHWFFIALVLIVIAWTLLRTGFLLPFQQSRLSWIVSGSSGVSLSKVALSIAISLALLSALKPVRQLTIGNFAGDNWAHHPVAGKKFDEASPRANILFAYLAGSAEEIAKLANQVFNSIFAGSANNESPRWLLKAMVSASASHIDDPELLDMIETYGEACLEPIIGSMAPYDFWLKDEEKRMSLVWQKFAERIPFGGTKTCLDLRNSLEMKIVAWSSHHQDTVGFVDWQPHGISDQLPETKSFDWVSNMFASQALLNHIQNMEGHAVNHLDNPDGANFGGGIKVWRYIRKFFSVDAWEKFLFGNEGGTLSASETADNLSHLLKMAPEIKGRILFYLIASFPLWLFWAALLGRFGPLIFWFLTYLSIVMWEPLWTLSYNLLMAQLNTEKYLGAVAQLRDAVSITAVGLLRGRINKAIEVYVMTQCGIAMILTSFAVWMGKGWLQGERENVPGGWMLRKLF